MQSLPKRDSAKKNRDYEPEIYPQKRITCLSLIQIPLEKGENDSSKTNNRNYSFPVILKIS
jgi:hypothetical protein